MLIFGQDSVCPPTTVGHDVLYTKIVHVPTNKRPRSFRSQTVTLLAHLQYIVLKWMNNSIIKYYF